MVSNLPLFSLKFKNLKLKDNLFRYILICLSILLLICFYFKAVPFIILTYMILSIIKISLSKIRKKTHEKYIFIFFAINALIIVQSFLPSRMLKVTSKEQLSTFPQEKEPQEYKIAPNDVLKINVYYQNGEDF